MGAYPSLDIFNIFFLFKLLSTQSQFTFLNSLEYLIEFTPMTSVMTAYTIISVIVFFIVTFN